MPRAVVEFLARRVVSSVRELEGALNRIAAYAMMTGRPIDVAFDEADDDHKSRLSYLLLLTALVISPVSYVAPARETGILFGTLLGARYLAEGATARRIAGATAMVLGIVLLALG